MNPKMKKKIIAFYYLSIAEVTYSYYDRKFSSNLGIQR